jgi:hypothetical protein
MNLGIWGLILDIVGVILLWKFGLTENIDRRGLTVLASCEIDEEEKKKGRFYDFMSKVALLLLIAGFALQIVYSLQSQSVSKLNQEKTSKSQGAAPQNKGQF